MSLNDEEDDIEFINYIPLLASPINSSTCSTSIHDKCPFKQHISENGQNFGSAISSNISQRNFKTLRASHLSQYRDCNRENNTEDKNVISTGIAVNEKYQSVLKLKEKAPQISSAAKRKSFIKERGMLAKCFLARLEDEVFQGRLTSSLEKKEIGIVWSKSFSTTAGRANLKRNNKDAPLGKKTYAYIELSDKVIVTKERLYNTLAHEVCHLACWIIDNEMQNPHGACFKAWGKRIMNNMPYIEITSKHNYDIDFKYKWLCINEKCNKLYGRHSKSINPQKQVCRLCKSQIKQICPKIKQPNAFQIFLKENSKRLRKLHPHITHKELMKKLSDEYHRTKDAKQNVSKSVSLISSSDL
ncbi:protein-DNA covalent cross-linking repair protein [Schizosaccharomyces pombe]|uniref:HMG box-containing protein SPBC19G7.04 n=1 Tax=Schizosaccharomyces pombe (strain 972 / ATCC 24843) TaxID=284812 RepID=YGM4_SCHPO